VAFTYFKVKSAKYLCLLQVHGLGLGLVYITVAHRSISRNYFPWLYVVKGD